MDATQGLGCHLERLLELAASGNKASDPREERLFRTLLAICTRKASVQDGRPDALDALGGGDIAIPLVHISATSSGVVQALALQALKTWIEDHEECLKTCIHANAVQLLVRIVATALPSAAADVAAAYTASMAVILLRSMVRDGGNEGSEAFMAARGVETLLHMVAPDSCLDDRSCCLVLYLLNEATRRSAEVLQRCVDQGAISLVVNILRLPICEATKFASLILNRWSLAAQHLASIRDAGSNDALLQVLLQAYDFPNTVENETVAYTLSAFAIISQDDVSRIRKELLGCPRSLAAISTAVAQYEHCFHGVGFPHALMCMLMDGSQGPLIIAALAANGLLPLWLDARHVGDQLTERAAHLDAITALTSIKDTQEMLETTIGATQLLQRSAAFVPVMTVDDRLEALAAGALDEFTSSSISPSSTESLRLEHLMSCSSLEQQIEELGGSRTPTPSGAVDAWALVRHGSGCELTPPHTVHRAANVVLNLNVTDSSPSGCPPDNRPTPLRLSFVASTPIRCISHGMGTSYLPSSTTSSRCLEALKTLYKCSRNAGNDVYVHSSKRIRSFGDFCGLQFSKKDVGVERYDTLRFVAGGREVPAVGFILEAHSPFLRGLLSTIESVHERVVVPELGCFSPETTHRLFLMAVEYCYTGSVEKLGVKSVDNAFDLWILAEFLQMDGLQRYCEATIATWFAKDRMVIERCLNLAETYPSAAPLRRLVARHLLSIIVGRDEEEEENEFMDSRGCRIVDSDALPSMIAPYATTLARDMGAELRARLNTMYAGC